MSKRLVIEGKTIGALDSLYDNATYKNCTFEVGNITATNSRYIDCSFKHNQFYNVLFCYFDNCTIENCKFIRGNNRAVEFSRCFINGLSANRIRPHTLSFRFCKLENLVFENSALWNFFCNSDMKDSAFHNVTFEQSDIATCNLYNVEFRDCNMRFSHIDHVQFTDCYMSTLKLDVTLLRACGVKKSVLNFNCPYMVSYMLTPFARGHKMAYVAWSQVPVAFDESPVTTFKLVDYLESCPIEFVHWALGILMMFIVSDSEFPRLPMPLNPMEIGNLDPAAYPKIFAAVKQFPDFYEDGQLPNVIFTPL